MKKVEAKIQKKDTEKGENNTPWMRGK